MSEMTRRDAIKLTAAAGAAAVAALAVPSKGHAQLFGDFWVYCPKCGMADKVSDITKNHDCSKDGTQTVKDGEAVVECELGHHPAGNKVSGVTRQHKCEEKLPGGGECGKQCAGCPAPPNANK